MTISPIIAKTLVSLRRLILSYVQIYNLARLHREDDLKNHLAAHMAPQNLTNGESPNTEAAPPQAGAEAFGSRRNAIYPGAPGAPRSSNGTLNDRSGITDETAATNGSPSVVTSNSSISPPSTVASEGAASANSASTVSQTDRRTS